MRSCLVAVALSTLVLCGCASIGLTASRPVVCSFCDLEQSAARDCVKCGMNMEPLVPISIEEEQRAMRKALATVASMPDNLPLAAYSNPQRPPTWVNGMGLGRLERATGRRYVVGHSGLHDSESSATRDALDTAGAGPWVQQYTEVSVVLKQRRVVVLYQTQCLVEVPGEAYSPR